MSFRQGDTEFLWTKGACGSVRADCETNVLSRADSVLGAYEQPGIQDFLPHSTSSAISIDRLQRCTRPEGSEQSSWFRPVRPTLIELLAFPSILFIGARLLASTCVIPRDGEI